jgi:NADPH:quinone reductase-like Zn-dependent oxidoreductase
MHPKLGRRGPISAHQCAANLGACAKLLGADYGINYKTHPDWEREVLRLTAGRGSMW